MADDQAHIKTAYPLPVYNYRVTISSGSESQEIGFSEVSGLSIEADPVVYSHGLSFLTGRNIIPGRPKPVTITLKKGVVKHSSKLLIDWFTNTYNLLPYLGAKRLVTIDLCDEKATPLIRWTARNALPIKLEGATLDANSNDVAIDTLTLIVDELHISYDP